MKILYIATYVSDHDSWSETNKVYDLPGFFFHQNIKEVFVFISNTLFTRTSDNFPYYIHYEKYSCHLLKNNGSAVIIITDKEYPHQVAKKILFQVISSNTKVDLNKVHQKFKNPKTDKLYNLSVELDEVKTIMVENIEKILGRGEKLDDIVDRTNLLNISSKKFLKESKKLNSCCNIL